jgi:hypothetical protein
LCNGGEREIHGSPLHLSDSGVDLVPGHFAIHWSYNLESKTTRSVVLDVFDSNLWANFFYNRGQDRIEETFRHPHGSYHQNPFLVHMIYLKNAVRRWSTTLDHVDIQLNSWVSGVEFYMRTTDTECVLGERIAGRHI